ncbi:type I-E CRISPR-associated protein Cse2/CasB [Streptomyces sp. NPDC101209]|uniref:type I-E CRISPR-associated protein Cse2/CasB n=1 Tax=Streptomyces sp. NPDC101209 TaxID=3366129 RepID=UPI0038255A4E
MSSILPVPRSGAAGYTPPAWHARLEQQLAAVRRDPGLAAACRRGRNVEPLDELKMTGPLVYILEGGPETPAQDQVGSGQWDAILAAAHHTLAFYACHQQSKTTVLHRRSVSVGAAARQLQAAMPSKEGAALRFRAARGADSLPELLGHLRTLISLMRTYDVPLDYVALAEALARWEHPEARNRIRRRWGLDFHRTPAPKTPTLAPTHDPDSSADASPAAAESA